MIRRERSMTAMVATRADPSSTARRPESPPAGPRRRRVRALERIPWGRIGLVTGWILLGLLIAALWGSLLLGDSLTTPVAE